MSEQLTIEPGQHWRDHDGHAEVLTVFTCGKVGYAALQRTFASGKRGLRPFVFPVKSMLKGDDGWRRVA